MYGGWLEGLPFDIESKLVSVILAPQAYCITSWFMVVRTKSLIAWPGYTVDIYSFTITEKTSVDWNVLDWARKFYSELKLDRICNRKPLNCLRDQVIENLKVRALLFHVPHIGRYVNLLTIAIGMGYKSISIKQAWLWNCSNQQLIIKIQYSYCKANL